MDKLRQASAFKIDSIDYPTRTLKTPYPGIAPSVVTVKVFYSGKTNSNKLARVQPSLPTAHAVEEAVKKMQMVIEEHNRERPVSSWLLKVVGRHEFIFGDLPLIDHHYIRDCLLNSKEVSLKLVLRVNDAKKLAKSKRHSVVMTASKFASISEEFAPVSSPLLAPLSSPTASASPSQEIDASSRSCFSASLRDHKDPMIDSLFQLSVASICIPHSLVDAAEKTSAENRSADSLGAVACEFGVLFGVTYLAKLELTPEFRLGFSPDSRSMYVASANDHVVRFDSLPISRIPFGSRVSCTIYYRSKGKEHVLGGMTFAVYTHDQVLTCGSHLHTFWTIKHSKANPLSVVVPENKVIRGSSSISLKFSSAEAPVIKDIVVARNYTALLHIQEPAADVLRSLTKILSADALSTLTSDDKQLLWQYRHWARSHPHALCKVLQCVDWSQKEQEIEMLSMMKEWETLSRQDALGLLDACYPHPEVRAFAVEALASIDDDYLIGIMLQLTQALKYECYHLSALALFLLRRALSNRLIGHRFFWYLKAEIHQVEIRERYGLIIEAYLHACGDFRRDIFRENKVLNDLTAVGNLIKSTPAAERLQKLRRELSLILFPNHPDGFLIPTDFGVRVKGLVIDKCKYMDSKKLPLWLVFENADPDGSNVYVIFKVGDDLRQDILTLQMISLMYNQVLKSPLALDLRMRPYAVVATGAAPNHTSAVRAAH
jgi:hypothetical protein